MKKIPIQSVKRAFDILDFLSVGSLSKKGESLQDIAKSVNLADTTTHNILKTMVACGYVSRAEARLYTLGPKCIGLSRANSISKSLDAITAVMTRLSETTGESTVLTTLINGKSYQPITVSGTQTIRVSSGVETGLAFWGLVTARVLAAYSSPDELALIIETNGLPGPEWPVIQSRQDLDAQLIDIRREGVARKTTDDLKAIAVPILDDERNVRAALGIYLPIFRATDEHMRLIEDEIKKTALIMVPLLTQ
ncbi:MAG: IclR family transcriptional regulator [Planctomycetota bacterium]